MTRTHSVGLIWTRDRPVAETRPLALGKFFAQCDLFKEMLPIEDLWCIHSGLEVSKSCRGPTAAHVAITIQQDATICNLFISVNFSTCFGWYVHPSSGVHITVSTVTVS